MLVRRLYELIEEPLFASAIAEEASADQKSRRQDGLLTWPLFVEFAIPLVQELAPAPGKVDRRVVYRNLIDFLIQLDNQDAVGFRASTRHRDVSRRSGSWMAGRRNGSILVPASSLAAMRQRIQDASTREVTPPLSRLLAAWLRILNSLEPSAQPSS